MVYVFRHYYVTTPGTTTKSVVCEKCGERFHYGLTRVGRGEAQSPYFLDNAGAMGRAEEEAARSLEARLERGVEPVPCPNCHWLQRNMVREIRRRSHPGLFWLGIAPPAVLGLALWLTVFLGTEFFRHELSDENARIAWGVAFAMLLFLVGGLGGRWRLLRKIDPNRGWSPPPGARLDRDQTDHSNDDVSAVALGYAGAGVARPPTRRHPALKPALLLGSGILCCLVAVAACIKAVNYGDDYVVVPLLGGLFLGFPLLLWGLKEFRSIGY